MTIKLPTITMPTLRRNRCRVIAVQCGLCGLWVKPRYLRVPTMICRDCEATGRHLVPQPRPGGSRDPRGSATQARQDLRTEAGHAEVAGAFSDSLAAGSSCLKASPT